MYPFAALGGAVEPKVVVPPAGWIGDHRVAVRDQLYRGPAPAPRRAGYPGSRRRLAEQVGRIG